MILTAGLIYVGDGAAPAFQPSEDLMAVAVESLEGSGERFAQESNGWLPLIVESGEAGGGDFGFIPAFSLPEDSRDIVRF